MEEVFRIDRKLPDTWQDALRDFLFWKQGQGIAPATLEDYEKHVTRFFTRFPDAYNPKTLRARVLEYMAQDVMPATFNLRRAYLKAFFTWCVREGIFPENPLHDIPKKKDPGRIRHLPEEALQQLLAMPDRKTFAGLRDYALILLSISTGIRPGEALSLSSGDVDLRGLTVIVGRNVAKTRTERTLPILPQVAEAIRDLMSARHPEWGADTPLFCSFSGRRLIVEEWGDRLELYARRLGVKITPMQPP